MARVMRKMLSKSNSSDNRPQRMRDIGGTGGLGSDSAVCPSHQRPTGRRKLKGFDSVHIGRFPLHGHKLGIP